MKDFLAGRAVYKPLNGFGTNLRDEESASSLLPTFEGGTRGGRFSPAMPEQDEPVPGYDAPATANGECCRRGAPELELIQTEGKIEQIIVTCGCGERITLHCSY